MSQDGLVVLSILSIENVVVQSLDFVDSLSKFAIEQPRKITL